MGTESFPGVERPGRGVDHPPPSRAEVKERVQLYLYPPPLDPRGLFYGEIYLYFTFTCKSFGGKCSVDKTERRKVISENTVVLWSPIWQIVSDNFVYRFKIIRKPYARTCQRLSYCTRVWPPAVAFKLIFSVLLLCGFRTGLLLQLLLEWSNHKGWNGRSEWHS